MGIQIVHWLIKIMALKAITQANYLIKTHKILYFFIYIFLLCINGSLDIYLSDYIVSFLRYDILDAHL